MADSPNLAECFIWGFEDRAGIAVQMRICQAIDDLANTAAAQRDRCEGAFNVGWWLLELTSQDEVRPD
jgi:hypothetical protein